MRETQPSAIEELAGRVRQLHCEAVTAYTPVVEELIQAGNRDSKQIERTLDGLLDFCGDASALELYRSLCRYYFEIAPAAAVDYVQAYREMYNSDRDVVSEGEE